MLSCKASPARCAQLCHSLVTETAFTVETQSVTFPALNLECGVRLLNVDVAYETYGTLNRERSNAILVLHAFSGDAHAAGAKAAGWWSNMIGPGKAFDTDRYFVICSNVLGGCRGTTGPGSINPETGCPWAMTLPGHHRRRHGAAAKDC